MIRVIGVDVIKDPKKSRHMKLEHLEVADLCFHFIFIANLRSRTIRSWSSSEYYSKIA